MNSTPTQALLEIRPLNPEAKVLTIKVLTIVLQVTPHLYDYVIANTNQFFKLT